MTVVRTVGLVCLRGSATRYCMIPNLYVVVSQNTGTPKKTPNEYNRYYGGPQKGTPKFGTPPFLSLEFGCGGRLGLPMFGSDNGAQCIVPQLTWRFSRPRLKRTGILLALRDIAFPLILHPHTPLICNIPNIL